MGDASRLLSPSALALGPRVEPVADEGAVALAFDLRGLDGPLAELCRRHPRLELRPDPDDRSPASDRGTLRGPVVALRALVAEHPTLDPLLAAWEASRQPLPEPRLMGILNVTPDSFSDGGRYVEPAVAIVRGEELAREGAAWIDVGGESTRPGAAPVPAQEELQRVLPVVRALAAAGHAVSIDTRKSVVAKAAVEAGARMINDVSGGTADPAMLATAAAAGCELVLMHSQGEPASMQADPRYGDPVREVADFLRARAAAAVEAGVAPDRITLDPGIGFGKRLEHNLALLRRLGELRSLGLPLLLGLSRKSFIGHLTGAERQQDWEAARRADRPAERLGGSLAALTVAVQAGASLLRVHDVAPSAEALRVAVALRQDPAS